MSQTAWPAAGEPGTDEAESEGRPSQDEAPASGPGGGNPAVHESDTEASPQVISRIPQLPPAPGIRARVLRRPLFVWQRQSWWAELAVIGCFYLIYESTRFVASPNVGVALAHGRDLIQAEQWLHLDPERELNRFLNSWDFLSDLAGYYYSTLHFIVTPLVLVYLWRRRPAAYGWLRSALVLATAIGLAVYVVWPAAPPRFTVHGFVDTLVHQHIMGMADPHGVTSLINQYAAMPSLHVGWAIWCAAAVVLTSRSHWRHLAWLYPAATTFVVMATANHYLFDALAGAVLILACLAVTSRPRRSSMGQILVADFQSERNGNAQRGNAGRLQATESA